LLYPRIKRFRLNLPAPISPERIQALQGLPFKIDVNILKMGWERALRENQT